MQIVKFLLLLITSSSALLVGVDISHVELFESHNVTCLNEYGQPKDPFQLFKENSIPLIRLRLFTANEEQARKDPYNYGHTLNHTLKLACRVNTHGLALMLDLHYSDTWADPSQQTKPTSWANLTFEQLTIALYNYTCDTLLAFVEQGTITQYVQIGNEITHGMLWPDGKLDNDSNWPQFITLLHTASRAVRSVLDKKTTKIIVHITSSTNWSHANYFFDRLIGTVDFDIIGLSYYPEWHGTLTELRYCLEQLSVTYNKSIFIVETNYPWKEDKYTKKSMKNITGFDETPEGQVQYAEYLVKMLCNLRGRTMQTALLWWAAEYVDTEIGANLGGFSRTSFFNASGVALPILHAFGKLDQCDYRGGNRLLNALIWSVICSSVIVGILYRFRKYSKKRRTYL